MSIKRRVIRASLRILVICTAAVLISASSQPQTENPTLAERLASLRPSNPEAYYLLGEEAADLGEVETARRLFALAATLEPERFGRSACLAIASLEAAGSGTHGHFLRLAEMFPQPESRGRVPKLVTWTETHGNDLGAAYASAVIGYHRIGEDRRAHRLPDSLPALSAFLEEPPPAMTTLLDETRKLSSVQPVCETCQNEQVTVCPACNGNTSVSCAVCRGRRVTMCRTCNGLPGLAPDIVTLSSMLRLELTLLSGSEATWSDQLNLDRGRTRRLLLPGRLAETLGFDPQATIYREGRWQRP